MAAHQAVSVRITKARRMAEQNGDAYTLQCLDDCEQKLQAIKDKSVSPPTRVWRDFLHQQLREEVENFIRAQERWNTMSDEDRQEESQMLIRSGLVISRSSRRSR